MILIRVRSHWRLDRVKSFKEGPSCLTQTNNVTIMGLFTVVAQNPAEQTSTNYSRVVISVSTLL